MFTFVRSRRKGRGERNADSNNKERASAERAKERVKKKKKKEKEKVGIILLLLLLRFWLYHSPTSCGIGIAATVRRWAYSKTATIYSGRVGNQIVVVVE